MARNIQQIKKRKEAVIAQIGKVQDVANIKIDKLNEELTVLESELQDHVAILEAEIALIRDGVVNDNAVPINLCNTLFPESVDSDVEEF